MKYWPVQSFEVLGSPQKTRNRLPLKLGKKAGYVLAHNKYKHGKHKRNKLLCLLHIYFVVYTPTATVYTGRCILGKGLLYFHVGHEKAPDGF